MNANRLWSIEPRRRSCSWYTLYSEVGPDRPSYLLFYCTNSRPDREGPKRASQGGRAQPRCKKYERTYTCPCLDKRGTFEERERERERERETPTKLISTVYPSIASFFSMAPKWPQMAWGRRLAFSVIACWREAYLSLTKWKQLQKSSLECLFNPLYNECTLGSLWRETAFVRPLLCVTKHDGWSLESTQMDLNSLCFDCSMNVFHFFFFFSLFSCRIDYEQLHKLRSTSYSAQLCSALLSSACVFLCTGR